VLPFELLTKSSTSQYQLRVAINADAPAGKQFKIVVKGFKKE
jgi:hypothetical protein